MHYHYPPRQAVRLTAEMLPRAAKEEQHRLESLLKLRPVDNDAGVQFQVALSLAACPEEVASAIVSELVHRESLDRLTASGQTRALDPFPLLDVDQLPVLGLAEG